MPSTAKSRSAGKKQRGANAPSTARKSSKGEAQNVSTTRAAVEDRDQVGRGNTDFSRTANKQISGHRTAMTRRAQGKRDARQAGRPIRGGRAE